MRKIVCVLLSFTLLSLGGCGISVRSPLAAESGKTSTNPPVALVSAAPPVSAASPRERESNTAITPDNQLVGLDLPVVSLPDVMLSIRWQEDGPDRVSIDNHSVQTDSEAITLPIGKATLITFRRDNFTSVTADLPGASTYTVYWLCVSSPLSDPDRHGVNTYILEGQVTGAPEAAKQQLLETAQTWNPPGT